MYSTHNQSVGAVGSRMAIASLALGTILLAGCMLEPEPLRWKLAAGDVLHYSMVQQTEMTMEGGPADMSTRQSQTTDVTWNVQSVDAAGQAVILLTFDRIRMTMPTPMGRDLDYDSASDEPPSGMAAMIAPLFESMTSNQFVMTLSARGQIVDLQVPEEMTAALAEMPGSGMMGDMASAEGVRKMIMQGAFVLPEQIPQVGDHWTQTMTIEIPMAGTQVVETTYTYEGERDVDGARMAVFRPSVDIRFEGGMMQMNVTEQESGGEVLFDADAGRMVSTKLTQDYTMEVTTIGQTMQQKLHQQLDVRASDGSEAEPPAEVTTVAN